MGEGNGHGCLTLLIVFILGYGFGESDGKIGERRKANNLETTIVRAEKMVDVNGDGLDDIPCIDANGKRYVLYAHEGEDGEISYLPKDPQLRTDYDENNGEEYR